MLHLAIVQATDMYEPCSHAQPVWQFALLSALCCQAASAWAKYHREHAILHNWKKKKPDCLLSADLATLRRTIQPTYNLVTALRAHAQASQEAMGAMPGGPMNISPFSQVRGRNNDQGLWACALFMGEPFR